MTMARRFSFIGGAAALSMALAACGGGGGTAADGAETAADGDGGQTAVGAVIKGLDNPFFQYMEQGITEQAEEAGVEAEVQAAANIGDTTGQAERLTAMAQQDFDCFIVNPISGSNLAQALAQVSRDGKPVVNIDLPVDPAAAEEAGIDIATYIGTDNVDAGRLAGEHMVEELGGSGQVALIGGIAGDVTSQARLDGFTEAAESSLEIVQTVAADWERQRALTAATDIMRANPELRGFFAANDDMGLGIARAVANEGRTGEIAVISVDGNPDALEAVQAGDLTATVAQYPYAIGQLGVQACNAVVAGEEVPEQVESPVALVTQDVAQQAIDAFPQPFQEFENPLAGS